MSKALDIRGLRKVYGNGFEALHGIDLTVEEGDFFGLLGPNGAGKSTAIGIVCSLVRKTAGQVRVFGIDIDRDFSSAKSHIGLVPQEFNFHVFEPVIEILINQAGYYGIPRRIASERAERNLHQLGLWDKRNSIARNLSGGMKRRLMIARALTHEPRLLILDEPTAGVDIEIRRSMWRFMRERNRAGTTIILTTHYLEEAEALCDTIAIINDGRVIEHADKKTLLTRMPRETFILDLRRPLTQLPAIPDFGLRQIDPLTLEVDLTRHCTLNDLFQALSRHGIEVLSLRNESNRLEQLFMEIVGNDDRERQA